MDARVNQIRNEKGAGSNLLHIHPSVQYWVKLISKRYKNDIRAGF